jgi:hypothetical protein
MVNDKKSKLIIHAPGLKLHFPRKQVYPSSGEVQLRCKCGSMRFRLFVKPMAEHDNKWARCTSVVCTNARCQKIMGITPEAILDTEGEREELEKEEREYVKPN